MPRTYVDTLEMVEREGPDGTLVTTSLLSLFNVTSRLIAIGISMLIEKPPGTSSVETRELAALATQYRAQVIVGLNMLICSIYHRALEVMGGREAVTAVSVEWSEDPTRMLDLGLPREDLPLLNFANSLHGIDLLTFVEAAIEVARV